MRRRRILSRKPAKPRPRKTVTPERGTASNAVRRVSPSVTDLQKQLEHQARELEEAREHLAVVEALLAGDRDEGAKAMARHIKQGVKYWSRALPQP